MVDAFITSLINAAKNDESIVLLTGDLGYGVVTRFEKEFPNRFFNCGVAEQNMIGVAAGLASEGKKVFVYSIGNFVTQRVLEHLRNDVCFMNLDVNIVAMGAGLEYGQLGFSHHTTEDLACMRACPNFSIYSPATAKECEYSMQKMLNSSSPTYLRINKAGARLEETEVNMLNKVFGGGDIAIFATGTIVAEAVEAAKTLAKNNIDVAVYSCPVVKGLGVKEKIKAELEKYKLVISLEEHSKIGGFGSSISGIIATEKNMPRLIIMGIDDKFLDTVGDRNYLRHCYNIDSCAIIEKIKGEINGN